MSMAFHSAHFCVISKKKKALWDHPHKKAIKLNWAQNLYLLTANETPHLNPDLKHAQVTTG